MPFFVNTYDDDDDEDDSSPFRRNRNGVIIFYALGACGHMVARTIITGHVFSNGPKQQQ
jgi:hypothetical protein